MNMKRYFFAGTIAAVMAVTVSFAHQAQRIDPRSEVAAQAREDKKKLREVRVKKGLKEAARLSGGGFVEAVDFDDELSAKDLSILAYPSQLIVRGVIKRNASVIVRADMGLDQPVEQVMTDYTVQVFDVYKGDVRLTGRDIQVRIPGGRVEFGNGLYAEAKTPGFLRPLNQEEFIMFLRPFESGIVYSVTMGRQV